MSTENLYGRMFLTPQEVEFLTGHTARGQRRYDTQARELAFMKIPFIRRSDGTLAVFRSHVEPSGQTTNQRQTPPTVRAP